MHLDLGIFPMPLKLYVRFHIIQIFMSAFNNYSQLAYKNITISDIHNTNANDQ